MKSVAWQTRPVGTYPNQQVRPEGEEIELSFMWEGLNTHTVHNFSTMTGHNGTCSEVITISRRDARLLAKRLIQCLEETRSDGEYRRDVGDKKSRRGGARSREARGSAGTTALSATSASRLAHLPDAPEQAGPPPGAPRSESSVPRRVGKP